MKKLFILMLASAMCASPFVQAVNMHKRRNIISPRAVVELQEGQEEHNILPLLPQQPPANPVMQPRTIWDTIDHTMAAFVGASAAYGIGHSLTSYISTATSQLMNSALNEDISLIDTSYAPEPPLVMGAASALCAAWYLGKSFFNAPYAPYYSQQERSADRFLGFGTLGLALLSGAAAQGLI